LMKNIYIRRIWGVRGIMIIFSTCSTVYWSKCWSQDKKDMHWIFFRPGKKIRIPPIMSLIP
jgi:hypothetical protein